MASYLTTFTGDGSEVHFTATFPVLRLSDLAVVVDNEWLALGVDYLVSGSTATPLATLTVAPGVGAVVTLRSAVGYTPTDPAAVTTAAPTLNETDTELWQAIGDQAAAEAAARAAADAAIIASGDEPANVGIAPVIATGSTEVRTVANRFADVVNVKDFGAVGDGTADDTAAIQAAVDYALANNKVKVYVPPGIYKTTDTIHIGYGVGYSTVSLEGDGGYDTTGITDIRATFVDRPIINIQGGRKAGVRKLWLSGYGSFTTPWNVSLAAAADPASYVITDAKDDVNAPSCAVCIDGYSGTTPANPYPRPAYPAYLGGSIPAEGSEYGRNYSSDCFVEDCLLRNTLIGICVQPNSNGNGDFMKFTNTVFNGHKVGISIGNSNARSTDYSNCNFNITHTLIDSMSYYKSSFGNYAGNLANIHANQCWRIFNVSLDWAVSATVTGFYCENMNSIGNIPGTKSRIRFVGCSFECIDYKWSGGFTENYPTIVANNRLIKFESCSFNGGRIGFAFEGAPTFEKCHFRPATYFSQAYFVSAQEKLAADWFGGVFTLDSNGMLNGFIDRCSLQGPGTTTSAEYDQSDTTAAYFVHGRARYGTPHVAPTAQLRGNAGSAMLPVGGRSASGRGFAVTTTDTMYQVGDVIAFDGAVASMFYLESITDIGGGSYTHQWNALTNFALVSGTYTPGSAWASSSLPYYFPIGVRHAGKSDRYFKTTAGSADVEYVDYLGTSQNVGSNFDETRRILWAGSNAYAGPMMPFNAANVHVHTISGSTITMSSAAVLTAWWADAPGICLIRLGA